MPEEQHVAPVTALEVVKHASSAYILDRHVGSYSLLA